MGSGCVLFIDLGYRGVIEFIRGVSGGVLFVDFEVFLDRGT